jgi:signal transduction histidine kinase
VTRRERASGFLWFLVMLAVLAVNFAVAYLLIGVIYDIVGWSPPPVVVQVLNSIGGLVLTALTIRAVTLMFHNRIFDGERRVYAPIIEALERMAKGDFSVRVDGPTGDRRQSHGLFGDLIETVNRTARELDQMETLRQEFISNVSHEIQSPLTSIRGFAQALQNDRLSAEARQHYLGIIETESVRLSRLTENLLKLSTLESEQVKFEPKAYRLDKQIRNLILACEPQWTAKALDMDVALDPVEIVADEDLLGQVWINLIHNGIKFTPEQGRICIELHRPGESIEFSISDTGPGISADDQMRIFERFFKSDKSRTRSDNGGSGLGLSIAQKIVAMHHGAIAVSSTLGAGATFTVTLPTA